MKKYILISILVLSIAHPANAQEQLFTYPKNDGPVFQSSLTTLVPDEDGMNSTENYRSTEIDPDNMPLFKQLRLRLTNKLMEERTPGEKKIWFKKKKNNTDQEEDILTDTKPDETEITKTIEEETISELPGDTISLEGGVNEQKTEKQLTLDAEYIDYEDTTGDVIATGRPVLFFPPQNVKVIADKMTYNEDSNILKGLGNVEVIRDGLVTNGNYIEIDMNEETIVMDSVSTRTPNMEMSANQVVQQDGLLIFKNGKITSDKSETYHLTSIMVGPKFGELMTEDDFDNLLFSGKKGNNVKLKIGSIYVEARKNHDVLKAKRIAVYHKNRKVFSWPGLTIYTDKQRKFFDGNYPEFGSKRNVGLFAGPGFVFGGPGGSIVKAVPFVNYKHKLGFGGAIKYRNTYNVTEFGYGSAADIFFLKGTQKLDDNLFLRYSVNSYMDEWFFGSRLPKYLAEVYYDKKFEHKNFLADNMDMTFRHRFGLGWMKDNDKNYNSENITSSEDDTVRLKYMAEIAQTLYKYKNEKERIAFDFGVTMQGSAAVYGTGDTQFVARIGPRMRFQYKNWLQDFGYLLSGYSDETPLPRYDMYRYGHSSIYLTEALRLNKYLSVGWSGNVNLSDDSPNGKMFQENRFIVAIGPDDFKVSIGYDFIRQTTYFGFDVMFDTKGTQVEYDKMEIKNPERLGQKPKDESERKLAFTSSKQNNEVNVSTTAKKDKGTSTKPAVLQYAQVIELEDPTKESIQ